MDRKPIFTGTAASGAAVRGHRVGLEVSEEILVSGLNVRTGLDGKGLVLTGLTIEDEFFTDLTGLASGEFAADELGKSAISQLEALGQHLCSALEAVYGPVNKLNYA